MSTITTTEFWTCTRAEYDSDTKHLRSTALKDFLPPDGNPRLFFLKHVERSLPPDEPTEAMLLGTLAHEFILEGRRTWTCWMAGVRRGRKWESFEASHAGAPIIRHDDELVILAQRESVLANIEARKLIESDGFHEQAITWEHTTGQPCKALLDRLQHNGIIADLKTASNPLPEPFFRQADNLGYFTSAAFYELARDAILGEITAPFRWIVVGKSPPYPCYVYECPPQVLRTARDQVLYQLDRLAECHASGVWNDPLANCVTELPIPRWCRQT